MAGMRGFLLSTIGVEYCLQRPPLSGQALLATLLSGSSQSLVNMALTLLQVRSRKTLSHGPHA